MAARMERVRSSVEVQEALPRYKLDRRLGIGSFGKVYLMEDRISGLRVAVKALRKRKIKEQGPHMEEKVRREIAVMRTLSHPHVVALYEVVETSKYILLVTEYAQGGELYNYIVDRERLPEPEARRIYHQIIAGLAYCHHMRVAHRDLKPENILLDESMNVKLADFGLSNLLRDGHFLSTSCGSPNYAAPEVIGRQLYAGPEADIWSSGVVLYTLVCGRLPFDDSNTVELYAKIKAGAYSFPSDVHLSAGVVDLLHHILQVDSLQRASVQEIRRHPWFLPWFIPQYLPLLPPPAATGPIVQSTGCSLGGSLPLVHELSVAAAPTAESSSAPWGNPEHGSTPYLHARVEGVAKWAPLTLQANRAWEAMVRVCFVLQGLGIRWLKLGPHSLECSWTLPFPRPKLLYPRSPSDHLHQSLSAPALPCQGGALVSPTADWMRKPGLEGWRHAFGVAEQLGGLPSWQEQQLASVPVISSPVSVIDARRHKAAGGVNGHWDGHKAAGGVNGHWDGIERGRGEDSSTNSDAEMDAIGVVEEPSSSKGPLLSKGGLWGGHKVWPDASEVPEDIREAFSRKLGDDRGTPRSSAFSPYERGVARPPGEDLWNRKRQTEGGGYLQNANGLPLSQHEQQAGQGPAKAQGPSTSGNHGPARLRVRGYSTAGAQVYQQEASSTRGGSAFRQWAAPGRQPDFLHPSAQLGGVWGNGLLPVPHGQSTQPGYGQVKRVEQVRFELQLFRAAGKAGKYMLDLQFLDGPQMGFFEICSSLVGELKRT